MCIRDRCRELGFGYLEPKDVFEVPRSRPRGLDATRIVRELRRKRGRILALNKAEEICYLDTSALVKRYVEEPGSEVVDGIYGMLIGVLRHYPSPIGILLNL